MKTQSHAARMGTVALLGCFGVAAFCMVILIALAFVAPTIMNGAVERYTDAAPSLPPVREMDEAEGDELKERLESFGEALDEGERTEPLVLAEDEINYLLRELAEEEGFDGGFYVELKPNQVTAQISVLMEEDLEIGPWTGSLKGRYVNGDATFDVVLVDGELDLRLVSFSVKGREAPGWLLGIVEDFIDETGVLESEDVREITKKLETFEIGTGEVRISGPSR